jgi:hypothetical protein
VTARREMDTMRERGAFTMVATLSAGCAPHQGNTLLARANCRHSENTECLFLRWVFAFCLRFRLSVSPSVGYHFFVECRRLLRLSDLGRESVIFPPPRSSSLTFFKSVCLPPTTQFRLCRAHWRRFIDLFLGQEPEISYITGSGKVATTRKGALPQQPGYSECPGTHTDHVGS